MVCCCQHEAVSWECNEWTSKRKNNIPLHNASSTLRCRRTEASRHLAVLKPEPNYFCHFWLVCPGAIVRWIRDGFDLCDYQSSRRHASKPSRVENCTRQSSKVALVKSATNRRARKAS